MSLERRLSRKEQVEYEQWLAEMAETVRVKPIADESPQDKQKRIAKLKKDFSAFCHYYFPDYMDAEFGWFHKKAVKQIVKSENIMFVGEWPREHAKSVVMDIFLPLFLKANNMLTGVVLASANEDKADGLLADLQEQLMFNERFIADYGPQYKSGKWDSGHFVTNDGIGFWAFGRGQSPRGVREAALRPNLIIVDDIDDAEICKNEKRVEEATDWILGDLYGCAPTKASRFVMIGNRIHKRSILAHVVGDVEDGDPVKDTITHMKVYALENPKTHKMDLSEKGVPAWKERYTRKQILTKMGNMGRRLALRELFHQHIVIGRIFQEEHLPWCELPPIQNCDKLVTYCDPSWKETKKNDFKAIVLVGMNGRYFDIYDCFVRQCTTPEMVRGHYALADNIPQNKVCRHYMEANFMQDIHLKKYDDEAESRGYSIAIRGDYRKKPDKVDRIENLSSYAERGLLRFNQAMRHSPDMQELRQQFLGFPDYPHDDGPDAVEGAVYKLNKPRIGKSKGIKSGKIPHNMKRRLN